jgi:hypothetical protein
VTSRSSAAFPTGVQRLMWGWENADSPPTPDSLFQPTLRMISCRLFSLFSPRLAASQHPTVHFEKLAPRARWSFICSRELNLLGRMAKNVVKSPASVLIFDCCLATVIPTLTILSVVRICRICLNCGPVLREVFHRKNFAS